MREFIFRVTNEFDGRDIKFILKRYFEFSDKLITRLKKDDGILLNGRKEFVIKETHTGDILRLNFIDEGSPGIIPENIPLDILFEDEDILVVNKPAGMPTHPSIGHFGGTLANAVMYHYRDIPFTFRAVTRLDRDTSGVTLIAKNSPSAHKLSMQLSCGQLKKEYLALCVGSPHQNSGRISCGIKRENEGIIKRCVSPDGKPSVTDYELIRKFAGLSLIAAFPKTGRTHQIRLHLSHIGIPIYSDFLYGREVPGERTRLHAAKISFIHPFSKKNVSISAPIPNDMLPEYFAQNPIKF